MVLISGPVPFVVGGPDRRLLVLGADQGRSGHAGEEHQGGQQEAGCTGKDHDRKVMPLDEPGPGGDTWCTMRHIPVQQSWWPWRGISRGGSSCA